MLRTPMALGALLALSITLGLTTPASAADGTPHLLLIHFGEAVYPTGALPENASDLTEVDVTTFRAGYVCDHFSLFWAEIARWNCKTSLLVGKTYAANPPPTLIGALKTQYSEDDIHLDFWQRHGRWFLLAALLLYIGMGFLRKTHKVEDVEGFATHKEKSDSKEGIPPTVAKLITGPVEWTEEDNAEALEIGMTPPAGIPQLGDVLRREANTQKTDGPPSADAGETDQTDEDEGDEEEPG